MIENNNVYNNTKMGIMFSRNMYDSVARNNIVSNEEDGIVISESHDNQIYNNKVLNSGRGIDLDKESYNNVIYNNAIRNIPVESDVLHIEEGGVEKNKVYDNDNNKTNASYEEVKSVNELKIKAQSTNIPSKEKQNNDPFSPN